jgi:hypothetical protein
VTATTAHPRTTARTFGPRHLILTGLLGAAIGAGATLAAVLAPTIAPAAATPSDAARATSAGEQYYAWYTRPSGVGAAPSLIPGAAGTTTAGEQYRAWYTRPGTEDRTLERTTDYYRTWYLRDAGDE